MFASFFLLPAQQVATLIPAPLKPVTLFGRWVIGAAFYNRFGPGSEIEYNEAGFMPALCRYGWRFGFFISDLLVDNERALVGVRDASGINKRLATFSISRDGTTVEVTERNQLYCMVQSDGRGISLGRFRIKAPGLGILSDAIIRFSGWWRGATRLARCRWRSETPRIAGLLARKPFLTIAMTDWEAELFEEERRMPLPS